LPIVILFSRCYTRDPYPCIRVIDIAPGKAIRCRIYVDAKLKRRFARPNADIFVKASRALHATDSNHHYRDFNGLVTTERRRNLAIHQNRAPQDRLRRGTRQRDWSLTTPAFAKRETASRGIARAILRSERKKKKKRNKIERKNLSRREADNHAGEISEGREISRTDRVNVPSDRSFSRGEQRGRGKYRPRSWIQSRACISSRDFARAAVSRAPLENCAEKREARHRAETQVRGEGYRGDNRYIATRIIPPPRQWLNSPSRDWCATPCLRNPVTFCSNNNNGALLQRERGRVNGGGENSSSDRILFSARNTRIWSRWEIK